MAAPDKNFFSIRLAKLGIDPTSDVQFRVFPGDLLPVALQKGEIDAFCQGDPLGWVVRERDNLHEVATNLDGEYAHRACCVLGIRGALIRDDKAAATAITEAVLEAQEFVANDPEETARIFAPYSPVAKPDQLRRILLEHTHGHHPIGADLKQELALYIDELKGISVIKPGTNTARLTDKVFADVLS